MNEINQSINRPKLDFVWFMLKLTYGIVPIVAGLDKLGTYKLVNWDIYLNPSIAHMLSISSGHFMIIVAGHFMMIVGIVEIIAGIIVLSKWTRYGAYLVALWLTAVIINLLSMGQYYDIAVRDAVIVVGALALAWLTEIKEGR